MTADLRGRLFELTVGLDLFRLPGELFYWRDGADEVDYVHKLGQHIAAIEIKSGRKKPLHGLTEFKRHVAHANGIIVSPETYPSFAASPALALKSAAAGET